MEEKNMICINCPMGCPLKVTIDGDDVKVSGNTCPRGEAYGKSEVLHPTRTVTSTICVEGKERVSCKTDKPIPKEKIFEVMEIIKAKRLKRSVNIGDILIENILDTGSNIVATKNIK